ncbi:MAG: hypothetical protein IJW45_04425 [Oscillospiraceae bacterium]|nr:hypothetical protein [Oscillospiraceae bacterium]
MKKIIALLTVLMLCAAMVVPASAANEFTPSVSNKPAPEIVPVVDPNGDPAIGEIIDEVQEIIDYVYEPCIVITPVSEATTSTEIPDDAEELLLDVYAKLQSGEMTIDYETLFGGVDNDDMVIRDLFDVTFLCEEHPEMLAPTGIVFRVTFDIGVEAGVDVYTTTYKNGEWVPAVSTVNNGDGTVTCLIEDFCPVAFSVEVEDDEPIEPPVQTGDQAGEQLYIWIAIASIALVAVVILSVVYFRGMKKSSN